jgi:hypothetical protein
LASFCGGGSGLANADIDLIAQNCLDAGMEHDRSAALHVQDRRLGQPESRSCRKTGSQPPVERPSKWADLCFWNTSAPNWQMTQAYSATATFNWNSTGALAGTVFIGVHVKDVNSVNSNGYDVVASTPVTVN